MLESGVEGTKDRVPGYFHNRVTTTRKKNNNYMKKESTTIPAMQV
jgi:hypothetical protein